MEPAKKSCRTTGKQHGAKRLAAIRRHGLVYSIVYSMFLYTMPQRSGRAVKNLRQGGLYDAYAVIDMVNKIDYCFGKGKAKGDRRREAGRFAN
jgi:hypothetical protein